MKLLSILLSAVVLVACGGGDETPVAVIQTRVPHPVANAATVTGGSAVAVHMYQALYGMAPSNATLNAHTAQATADPAAFAKTLANNFASTSSTALAKLVLDNLNVTAATVTAVNGQGQSEYAILLDALGQMFTFYGVDARGQIILNATNLLAGLETDVTYGVTAVSYNNQATVNTAYSSNIANTTPAAVSTATPNAGAAQNVAVGTLVTLDGSASKADVGRTLTYAWTLASRPAGSVAALSSAISAKPRFAADAAGTYLVSLIVNDGRLSSTSATVIISTFTPIFSANCASCHITQVANAHIVANGGYLRGPCTVCHGVKKISYHHIYAMKPATRAVCGSCHTGIDFATGKGLTLADAARGLTVSVHGHLFGPANNDTLCDLCHTEAKNAATHSWIN